MKRIITLTLFLIMAVIASNAQQNKIDDNKLKDKKQLKKTHRGKHPGHLIRQDEKADGSDKQLMKTHGPGYIHPDSLRDKKKERIRQHFEKVRQNQANEEYSPTKPQQKAKADKRRQDSLIEKQMRERYKKLKAQRMDTREKATESDSCSTEDSLALVAIYNNMNGENWTNQSNWLTDASVKDWWGITVENYRVTEISLANNQLEGSIPTELSDLTNLIRLQLYGNRLKGSIPPEIGNLKNLVFLYLANNQLEGSIPPEIGELTKLEYIELGDNKLTGEIPSELGNLTNLIKLQLASNQLTGAIPAELGNLANLQYLDLDNNHITGAIPPELGNLTNLQALWLWHNQLEGAIPKELGNLTNLTYLSLDFNQLEGSIPPELGALTNLTRLHLRNNQLKDAIPKELGNLTNLTDLSLHFNQLEGSIPTELGNLTNLTSLNLANNQLEGSIPAELGELTKLEYIGLGNNKLTGEIPSELGNLTNLIKLQLASNQLSGTIPPELGNLTNLTSLYLNDNQLEGSVPPEINNLTKLEVLYLYDNKLDKLPDLSGITSLSKCLIFENYFDFGDLETAGISDTINNYTYAPQGLIDQSIDTTDSQVTLTALTNSTNNTYQWFENGDSLINETGDNYTYDQSNSSTYYCKINNSNFPELTLQTPAVGEQIENGVKEKDYNALKAIYNKTEGSNWFNNTNWLTDNPVGNWHGITVDGTRVTSVKLNNNNLTGKFPEETFELDSLKMLIYWNNELTDTIPDKFNQVDKLNYIDLDENEFSGNIPSTIGTLDSLETAWITRNNFSGAFDYSTMQSLEGLYIYSNELKFSDLEDIGIAPGDISSYGYSPQSDLSKPDISVNGGQITLSVNASASDNQYIWYKDKEAIDTTTENTTTVIPEISATYYCKITNKQYPDLILKTKKFTYSLYSITFNVTDENSNAVEGAKVSIDGSSELTTNSNGKATIDTSNGSYDYTVSKDGYNDKSGSFKVAGEALTENVTLSESATNINLAEAGNIEIYPNPASDYIMIESAREIENIKIFNLLGEIVSVENTVTEKIRMNIDGLQQGVYMMKIKFSNGETGTQKLMIR